MYENYFNFHERPFRDSINPKYIYLSEKHSEALASFKYAIDHEKGFLMLTGEIGTGKTSIVKRFLMEFDDNLMVSTLTNPDLEPIDFFKILADEFKLGIIIDSKADFLIGFKKFLHKAHENGKNVLLIIDEAHKLNQKVLDEIRMLSNIEAPEYKMLNIFYVGQTEFNNLILKPQNYSLRQRIALNYLLESKQLDKFLTYFSFDAKENGKPIKTLIPKYRRNFTAIDRIEYNIFLEKFSYDKISNNVRIVGKFSLRWQPYNSSWRENSGKIFINLLKNNDSFKVLNLDYYGSKPPKK